MKKISEILKSLPVDTELIREFIGVILITAVIILPAYLQVRTMLNVALEGSVERTVQTIAYELRKQFELEVTSLETRAGFVEKHKISPRELVLALDDMKGENIGIISEKGELIAGKEKPPEQIIEATWLAYDGRSVIRYIHEVGLVFAVQMHVDGEPCILFDYYDDEAVRNKFRTISFNGDGTVILLNRLENWTVLADGNSPIKAFTELKEGFRILGEKIGYDDVSDTVKQDTGTICYRFNGEDYFIYTSTVFREHHFAISGYVPWESAAVGFESIYIMMLIAFALLILLFIMVIRSMIKSHENKRLEQEKLLALKASKTKSEFLSNMSHEIRTPINAILGMDEMILRECEDQSILEYAENVRTAGNNLLGIVNDILDFSKIEAGKMEIIPVEYDISSVLNDLANMIRQRAEKKYLQFIVKADKNLPTVLYGDEIRIKQVVTNILTNAVKYTERGFVIFSLEATKQDGDKITLKFTVKDTGIGIKPEDIKKLYSAFERIEEKRNRTIEGTGLGMNITQKILTMMNSKLEVSSVYGKGSTFSFEIEQKIIKSDPIGDFEKAYRKSLQNRKKYKEKFIAPDARILVVDDTAMNLTVVKGLLKQTKIKIDTADSGFKCLELVTKYHYDIIFLDIRMPEMDGIETLQEMKKLPNNLNSETPVISLTANAISGAREQYIAAGFKDYLTKPINSVKLEALIMRYLPKEKILDVVEETPAPVEENLNLPDWLMKVDGLDVKQGVEHCGDSESYLDALKVFANSITLGAEEIEIFFINDDWKNYTTKVHALKSSARVIGANELSERALKLEDAGNANRLDEIKKDTTPLLELYRSYREKLSPFIETEKIDSDKPFIESENLAEAYEAISDAVANFDIDTVEFVLSSLADYRIPDNELEKFNQLKTAASKLDWEKITALLK